MIGGKLYLNGRPLNLRGVGLHEDDPTVGFAVDNARRAQYIAEVKELGATIIRAHYPLHPYLEELADRDGILLWSEVPVYAVKTQYLKREIVRKLAAKELAANINANQNHPSIIVWSLGNELSSRPGPVQGDYIRRATAQAKALDPTRPIGLAVAGYPSVGCQPEYAPLDVVGINDYFGWYPGPNGVIADRDAALGLPRLGPRLLPAEGDHGDRVRRRGEPGRPGRGEGHVPVPAGLRELPPRDLRHEAVAQRCDLLGDRGVPRAAGLGRRQPASRPADPREGPAALRRPLEEAGVVRREPVVHADAADRPGPGQ